MVCQLIELLDTFYVSPYDCLLLLEYPNVSIHFDVGKLFIVKISEGGWNLIFALMIEKDVKCAGIIVELELSPHWLFYPPQNSAA